MLRCKLKGSWHITNKASSCAFYFPDSDSDSDSDLAKIPNLNLPIADEDRSQIQIWDTTVKIWICFLCSSSAFCAKADVTLGILKEQFNEVHISSKVKPTKLQPSPALWVIPQYCETYHILLLEKNVRGREMEGVNSAEFLKNNFSDWMFPTEFFRKNFGIFPMEYFRQNISGIFFLTECFRQNLSDKVFLTEFYPLLSNIVLKRSHNLSGRKWL